MYILDSDHSTPPDTFARILSPSLRCHDKVFNLQLYLPHFRLFRSDPRSICRNDPRSVFKSDPRSIANPKTPIHNPFILIIPKSYLASTSNSTKRSSQILLHLINNIFPPLFLNIHLLLLTSSLTIPR